MFGRLVWVIVAAALFPPPSQTCRELLVDMGYRPTKAPCEVVAVEIPAEWDEVYERYNRLQREGGFDLEPYKGKLCRRYTYEIPDLDARGNVLTFEGRVIGGDICSITLDGVMLPLRK